MQHPLYYFIIGIFIDLIIFEIFGNIKYNILNIYIIYLRMKKIVFGLLGSLVLGKFYIIGGMSYFKQYEKVFY